MFTIRQKQYLVFLTAFGGFFSPISANMYFLALNSLAKDLKVSNQLINLTLTSYMIFQSLAPTIFGDLADMTGRRSTYIIGFIIYIGTNIELALQNNYAALSILRCLQSTGSSDTVALGSGMVADISSSGERGPDIGYSQFGPMTAPAIAPVLGGILSQLLVLDYHGRSLSYSVHHYLSRDRPQRGWKLLGLTVRLEHGNMSSLNYLKIRKISASSELSRTASRQEKKTAQAELASKRKLRWPNPLKTTRAILEKVVDMLLVYNALVYTAFYNVTTSLPSLFAGNLWH